MYITKHADVRMNQRGIRKGQVALVLEHGEPDGDKVILTPKLARQISNALRQDIKMLEAIAKKGGVTAVVEGNTVITSYRTSSFSLTKGKILNA